MATKDELRKIRRALAVRVPVSMGILLAILHGTAGTWWWWQAWMMVTLFTVLVLAMSLYFLWSDPDFLLLRMQRREKEAAQKKIMGRANFAFVALLFVPGLDMRFGWSQAPAWVSIAGLVAFVVAYAAIIWVFKTNRHASRIVEVRPDQRVISTGPYAWVRHPMYTGVLVLYPAMLLALGSWWGALLSLALVVPLVQRIRNEEELLGRELPGYAEYCTATRYRLVPLVW